MNNVLGFAAARKQSRASLLAGWLDGGEVRVYTAPRPTDADTAITSQTLLVTFALDDPAGTATAGVFEAAAIDAALIAATGSAVWARVVDDAAGTAFDCDVGTTGSGALVQLDSVALVAGGYVTVTSFTLTER